MPDILSYSIIGLSVALMIHAAAAAVMEIAAISPAIAFIVVSLSVGVALIVWR